MREMTADRSRRESASTTHLPFNIFLFRRFSRSISALYRSFQVTCGQSMTMLLKMIILKMFFLVLDLLFVMKNIFVSISTYKKRSEAKFKEQKNLMAWKEVSFKKQIMTKNKYTSIFSRKIEAIVFLIFQILCKACEKNVYEQLTVFYVGCVV